MSYTRIIITVFVVSVSFMSGMAQNWEIYFGVSYSNMQNYEDGQQLILLDPLNAPRYMVNIHTGVNRNFIVSRNVLIQMGLRYQAKGSAVEARCVFPHDTIAKTQVHLAMIPVNVQIRLLRNKEFYLNGGLSGGMNIGSKSCAEKGLGVPRWGKQLDGQIGLRFPLINRMFGQLNYSQGFIAYKNGFQVKPHIQVRTNHLHHAYEFTIIYKL